VLKPSSFAHAVKSSIMRPTKPTPSPHEQSGHDHEHDQHDHGAHAAAPGKPHETASQAAPVFRIATMDCSSEESEIRRVLEPITSVRGLSFQLGARTLAIDAPAKHMPLILDSIRKAGFDPQPVAIKADSDTGTDSDEAHGLSGGLKRMVAALVTALGAEAIAFFAPEALAWKLVGMAVAFVAIGLAGLSTYKKGWFALRHAKLNINALMTVAVTGAFVIGQWPEAAMVMALYAIAEMIEAKAVDRARNAIKGLLALTPDMAEMLMPDGSWQATAVKSVALGATVRIKPGERVPLDGVVSKGSSAINQAPVTGESIPMDKAAGDLVFAGTVNETGALEFKVTAAASDSTLARIIHAVEQAQGTRAPTQRFVDRFASVYTPAVFALALAAAILMPWLMGVTWLAAAYKALVLLVIACPCALVISTPVTVVSGLAAAAKKGILIKGGAYLEDARKLKAIALDKTGTITEGKPKLVKWQLIDTNNANQAEIACLALSLSASSDHPVSKAIASGLAVEKFELLAVDNFTALAGRGVQGNVKGQSYTLGNHRLMEERKLCSPSLEATLKAHEEAGRTVTLLASSNGVLALFAVADTIKESSKAAIAELRALGVSPVMLTGDNAATAQALAAQSGIDDARGNLLPEDKLTALKDLQQRYGPTGMSGDGINDAPALAQADIGFAMGAAGTHIAMEAADVVIMNDDLRRIASTIRLSHNTHAVLWQNITLALGIKAVFLVLAIFSNASMWMAVFADMGASLLVIFNGLRLMRSKF
jgi:Zn2+/Cd2+-exporting ATPase